jgi:hypothetical protein
LIQKQSNLADQFAAIFKRAGWSVMDPVNTQLLDDYDGKRKRRFLLHPATPMLTASFKIVPKRCFASSARLASNANRHRCGRGVLAGIYDRGPSTF